MRIWGAASSWLAHFAWGTRFVRRIMMFSAILKAAFPFPMRCGKGGTRDGRRDFGSWTSVAHGCSLEEGFIQPLDVRLYVYRRKGHCSATSPESPPSCRSIPWSLVYIRRYYVYFCAGFCTDDTMHVAIEISQRFSCIMACPPRTSIPWPSQCSTFTLSSASALL